MKHYADHGAIRSRGKISRLPWSVRRTVNEKLRDNRQSSVIAQWLFEQTASEDLPDLKLKQGDSFGKIYADSKDPIESCGDCLSRYRYSRTYLAWLSEDMRGGSLGAILSHLDAATALGADVKKNTDGVSKIALSMILDRMERLTRDEKGASVAELRELTRSLATVNSVLVTSQKSAMDQRKLELLENEFNASEKGKPKEVLTPEEKEQRYKQIFGIA